jgi:DNA-binding LacI/PurR family transcriptional regulator
MIDIRKSPASSKPRVASYRQRMRAAGLRPVQIWVPDTRSSEFAAICKRQALAIATHDPGGKEIDAAFAAVQDWPEP